MNNTSQFSQRSLSFISTPTQSTSSQRMYHRGRTVSTLSTTPKNRGVRRETSIMTANTSSSSQTSSRGPNFNGDEDLQLCKSWLEISQDPLTGNGQTASSFWERVQVDFMLHRPEIRRTAASLKSRWGPMNRSVQKFALCVSQVNGMVISGKTGRDKMADAHTMYHRLEGHKFKSLDCYNLLSTAPKWKEYSSIRSANRNSKRASSSGPAEGKSNSVESDSNNVPNERPIGQKRAKRLRAMANTREELSSHQKSLAESTAKLAKEAVLQRKCLQTFSNDTILRADISHLDDETRELYQLQQQAIRKKMKAELELELLSNSD